jgi:hypothetical protein
MTGGEKKKTVETRKETTAERGKRSNARGEMIEILPENVRANRHGDQEVDRSVLKVLATMTTTTTTTIVPTKSSVNGMPVCPLIAMACRLTLVVEGESFMFFLLLLLLNCREFCCRVHASKLSPRLSAIGGALIGTKYILRSYR